MAKVKIAPKSVDLKRGVDHIGVSLGSIIHDGQGHVLLMKRGPGARDENGRWDICGGALEFGETIEDGIRREIKEELCAKAISIEFLTAYEAHREHSGANTHWICLLHAARVDPREVKIGEPHKIVEIGWFNSENLPEPRHSMFEKAWAGAVESGIVG